MAITLTVSSLNRDVMGNQRLHSAKVVTSGTYETNGFTFAASTVGLFGFTPGNPPRFTPAGGYSFEYVPSTGKVKVYQVGAITPTGTVTVATPTLTITTNATAATANTIGATTNALVAAATAVTLSGTASPISIAAATFSGTASTAGAQSEVSNGTSLALTTYVDAFGF